MTTLPAKAFRMLREHGPAALVRKIADYLHFFTVERLDLFLFHRHKWRVIGFWMLNRPVYTLLKLFGFREGEHQVGRLYHMRRLFRLIAREGYAGDILEFGSYQGFSLAWLARFRDRYGLKGRVIGIDSFAGLPHDSTVWRKGLFGDTSYDQAVGNVAAALGVRSPDEKDVHVIRGMFDDPAVRETVGRLTNRVLAAHVDCDLGAALALLDRIGSADPFFLLFDDWGCHPDEIPASFDRCAREMLKGTHRTLWSETAYTRYIAVHRAQPPSGEMP